MTKIEVLRKARFSLETFEDGKFWVYERKPGEASEKSLAVCRRYIEGFEEVTVHETFVLQCDSHFGDPVLYIDGFLWQLSPRDFLDVVRGLGKSGREWSDIVRVVVSCMVVPFRHPPIHRGYVTSFSCIIALFYKRRCPH